MNAKSAQNKANLLYSYNLFQRSLIFGAVALIFNGCRHNKTVKFIQSWFMTRLLVGCAQLLLAPEAVLSVCSVIGGTQSESNSKNSKNGFVNG